MSSLPPLRCRTSVARYPVSAASVSADPMPGSAPRYCRAIVLSLVAVLGDGCASGPDARPWREGGSAPSVDGPGDPTRARLALDVDVRNLPKSRIGNAARYTVFGQPYAVMDSAAGFREQGVASWYGAKFHGRDTSSGEPYDMHLMTAAHKHLPLPTFVRVTRTDNGQSIVVKVNDRGPFVDDRVIDLSYGAAARLGMLEKGTAPVEIEALSTHLPGVAGPVGTLVTRVRDAPPAAAASPAPASVSVSGPASVSRYDVPTGSGGPARWIQIGAFSDEDNARQALSAVAGSTGLGGRVERDSHDELYRVRLGPLHEPDELGGAIEALAQAGVGSYTMVPAAH